MDPNRHSNPMAAFLRASALVVPLLMCSGFLAAEDAAMPAPPAAHASSQVTDPDADCDSVVIGSPYIPVDSWIYPAMWRLYALGYVDGVYLGMRPWTRASVSRMLDEISSNLADADIDEDPNASQAQSTYDAITSQLRTNLTGPCQAQQSGAQVESVYTIARGISGTPLRDSFHLGSSIVNDYGRPYSNGFNNYSGVSGYATAGRFAVYVRAEFQGAPSATGYSAGLASQLSAVDGIPYLNPATGLPYNQATIPQGSISSTAQVRLLEAYASYQYLNHVFSFGKQDQWLGPAQGGSFAYSNNAQNVYGFEINRIEPLEIPLLSRATGPFRYEFLVGALKGHTLVQNPAYPAPNQPNVITPGDPWVHLEKLSFKPTSNLELGFERTVIWGGEGHSPVTIKNFLRSFFSTYSPAQDVKFGRKDPGARFGEFNLVYRLPFFRNWLTLYADGEVHDDVSPVDAPRRAAWRPGIYLSHVPGVPKLDIRAEAVTTDPPIRNSKGGDFMYWEFLEKQGYTNQGQLFGDWIGREDKGGQAWVTYHLSGNEWVQLGMRNQKAAKDFVAGGTTLNDVDLQVVKRLKRDLELKGNFTVEHWKAPIYPSGQPTYPAGQHTVTATTIQLTWYPERRVSF